MFGPKGVAGCPDILGSNFCSKIRVPLSCSVCGICILGDGRPRGDATLKACVTVSRRIRRCLPHEYSLSGSFTANWEQVLSRHRTCQIRKEPVQSCRDLSGAWLFQSLLCSQSDCYRSSCKG